MDEINGGTMRDYANMLNQKIKKSKSKSNSNAMCMPGKMSPWIGMIQKKDIKI